MKKTLIAVAAAAALATSSAFAEITFGTWLRGVLVPVAYDGVDYKAGLTQSWGGAARTAAIEVNGVSEDEKAGFSFAIRNQAGNYPAISMGDRSVIWVKPIDMLKLSVGIFDSGDNGFREGAAQFGSWNYLRNWETTGSFMHGDDGIMDGKAGDGFMAEVTPIDGLKVMVNIPFLLWSDGADYDGIGSVKDLFDEYERSKEGITISDAYDVYRDFQAGVAYTIDGIGTAKVLWQNKPRESGDYNNYGRLGLAFDLTAVENLYVAVGVKMDFGDKEYDGTALFPQIGVNASYKVMDALTVYAAGGVIIYKETKNDPLFGFSVGADYTIMDGLTANVDVRYLAKSGWDGTKADKSDALSFMAGLKKSVGSNASIAAGFQGVTNGKGFCSEINAGTKSDGTTHDGFMWAVPVVFEAWF